MDMQYRRPRYASLDTIRYDTTRHDTRTGSFQKILGFLPRATQDFSKRSPMLCLGCPLLRHVLCSAAAASSDHRKATLRQQGLPSFRTPLEYVTRYASSDHHHLPTYRPTEPLMRKREKSVVRVGKIFWFCQIYYINLPFLVLPNNAIQRSAHATRCEKNRGMHKTYVPYQNVGVTHIILLYIFFFTAVLRRAGRALSWDVAEAEGLNAIGWPTRGHGCNAETLSAYRE
jgi:hypothetical protein